MKPSHLFTALREAFKFRVPMLVTGAPGVGKSDIVRQAAEAAGAELMVSHPVVQDPTDAKGLPWIAPGGDSATFLPFGDLARAIANALDRLLIWFLDDLGQAPAATQAAYMQLLLNRAVNGHALPDSVVLVAATNRRIDRAGVTGILEPVKSRFFSILELEADIDDWGRWAIDHGMPPELIAFLRFRPDLLCAFSPSADMDNSPVPRTWSHVGKILSWDVPDAIRQELIAGAVGDGASVEFLAFLRLFHALPSIDAILIDPHTAPIPGEPGQLYAVTTALGMRANVQTFGRIATYAERMMDGGHGEFSALLLRDCVRKDTAIPNTPEFIRLATGDLGKLIGGNHV